MQTGKKACRIASENGVLFQMIQLGTLQDPLLRVYGQVSAQVRKISTKQNLINPRYIAQHAKHEIACRKSRIPMHAAEHISSGASSLSACDEPHLIDFQVLRGHASRPRTSWQLGPQWSVRHRVLPTR